VNGGETEKNSHRIRADGEHIRRIYVGLHRFRLTMNHIWLYLVDPPISSSTNGILGANDCVPFFLPHLLLKRIRQIRCTDLLIVLELEKLVFVVSGHVNEYV
jgi:hypothetical protein